LKAVEVQNKT